MPIHARPQLHHRNQDQRSLDSPMPAGFFRKLRSRTVGHPELRLAAAVLEDASHSFKRNHGAEEFHRRLLYWEVEQWFASRSLAPIFSFEKICSLLGLNADEIRKLLQRWTERRMNGPVPTFLEWTQPRLKRPALTLVMGARVPESRQTPAIPEATAPQSHGEGPDARGAAPGPRSRFA
jgi:hypothetical protein